jgi:hypothetical protein
MSKRILYVLTSLVLINLLLVPVFALSTTDVGLPDAGRSNLPSTEPAVIVKGIINTLIALLGLITVIIIIIAGFKYLTSGGNDEKIDEAKKLLWSGVIGLIIVLGAFGLTQFVLQKLVSDVFR